MSYTLVDTVALVEKMIIDLQPIYERWISRGITIRNDAYLPSHIPDLFLDSEGVNLGREGELCVIQMYCKDTGHTYLINISVLGLKAFDTSPGGNSDAEGKDAPDSTESDGIDNAENDLVSAISELNVNSTNTDDKNIQGRQHVAAKESIGGTHAPESTSLDSSIQASTSAGEDQTSTIRRRLTDDNQTGITSVNNTLTLRSILGSPYVPKVWFDVRNDNDALYTHFQICMDGVIDLQLMEYAANPWRESWLQPPGWILRDRVRGLFTCIKFDANLPDDILTNWINTKDQGKIYFNDHTKDGGYEVFKKRPLSNDLLRYCVNDVVHMPLLYGRYRAKMSIYMQQVVIWHSNKRLIESRRSDYRPDGPWKGQGPWYGNEWYNGETAMGPVWAFRHPQVDAQWVYVAD